MQLPNTSELANGIFTTNDLRVGFVYKDKWYLLAQSQ